MDLETGLVVGLTVQDADAGHTTTMVQTAISGAEQGGTPGRDRPSEVVGDKGHHSNDTPVALEELRLPESPVGSQIAGAATGRGSPRQAPQRMRIRDECEAPRGPRLLRQGAGTAHRADGYALPWKPWSRKGPVPTATETAIASVAPRGLPYKSDMLGGSMCRHFQGAEARVPLPQREAHART